MRVCTKKKHVSHAKNWISLLNSAGIKQKSSVNPTYNNLYAYAANNPVRYIDPDGRETGDDYDIIEDTAKGFKLAYDVWENTTPENFPNASTKAFENHVNEKPLFWAFAAGAGALYGLYKAGTGFTDFVDHCLEPFYELNSLLDDNGIDLFGLKYTVKNTDAKITKIWNFQGSSIDYTKITLKTNSSTQIAINSYTDLIVKMLYSLDLYWSDCKTKSSFDFKQITIAVKIKL